MGILSMVFSDWGRGKLSDTAVLLVVQEHGGRLVWKQSKGGQFMHLFY